ncbi:MAG: amino acid ABC transporter permease [Gordonia sp. (in: high G+C Gram-positive bacteria)]
MWSDLVALLPGLALSVQLTVASLAVGLPLGLAAGLVLHEGGRMQRWSVLAATELGRGFPALVTVYLVYFGLPEAGVVLAGFTAMVVAFGFITASYTADIFRTALSAIPTSQLDAAAALGLSRWVTLRRVVAPQAVKIVLVPLLGFAIIVFQASALAYSIGLRELLSRAYDRGTLSFDVMRSLLIAAVLYLVVSLALGHITKAVQRRTDPTHSSLPAGTRTILRRTLERSLS